MSRCVEVYIVYRCPSDLRNRNAAHSQAYRSYAVAGGLNGQGPISDIEVCKDISDIKRPSEKYIFLPECDVRGYNRGSWILRPVSGKWIDAFGIFHRGRSTSFGFADGHASKRSWQSQGLVDWNLLAIDEPQSFSFGRDALLGESAETEDWNWAVKGYAYKSLNGSIFRGK
jgi:prepilin-type processing-associated H-X9-DG protein